MNILPTYTFDTSALLNGAHIIKNATVISEQVLKELEQIKISSTKDEAIKYKARTLVRFLANHQAEWEIPKLNPHAVSWLIFKDKKLLSNHADSIIIAEAILIARKNKSQTIHFVTSDLAQALLAQQFPELLVEYYQETNLKENLWKGYQELSVSDTTLNDLYKNLDINILNLAINEYVSLMQQDKVIDILKWNGNNYDNLKYKDIKSDFFGTVQPKNLQQKMQFDLLQNRSIPVKVFRGPYGSGKTFLALVHATYYLKIHKFDKIVYVRNNVEVAGTQRLGALPGEEVEKLLPYIMPLADHFGSVDVLQDYITQGYIEPIHLGFMRGRSFNNSIIFVDEAENLTTDNVKLLLGRVGENSELWLLGDESQTDSDLFKKNNGIASILNSLKGEKLFGTIELQKTERGAVAQLSAKIK